MRTGRGPMGRGLPGAPEPHGRPPLGAVGEVAALTRDPVRLPVVGARGVEPELREVVELRPVAEGAALLLRLADRLRRADLAVRVLLPGLADVDVDLALALHAHLEGGRLA